MTPEVLYLAQIRRQLMRLVTTQKALVKLHGEPNASLAAAIFEVRALATAAQTAAVISQASKAEA